MSQPADNDKVTKHNERLFGIYENHLKSSNVKDYTETATRLTSWLGDTKAYYAAARPMIIKLLIIAQMTLRGAVGYPLDISVPFMPVRWLQHPMTSSYVTLIQAIRPFRELFVETPLKHAITYLLQTVEGIALSPATPAPLSQQATLQSLAPTPRTDNCVKELSTRDQKSRPASPQDSQSIQVHNSNPGAASTPQVSDQPLTGSRHSTGEAEQAFPNSASASDLPNTAESQRSTSSEITFIGMSHKTVAEFQDNASTTPLQGIQSSTGATRQGLRTKKSKKIDLSAFVQSDIQDFKQRQAQAQRGVPDAVPIKREPEIEENLVKSARQLADAKGIEFASLQPAIPSVAQLQLSPSHNQLLHGVAEPVPRSPQGAAQQVPLPHPELVSQEASHNLRYSESSAHLTTSPTLGQHNSKPADISPVSDSQPGVRSSIPLDKAPTISAGIPAPSLTLPSLSTNAQLAPPPSSTSTITDHLPDTPTTATPTAKLLAGGPIAPSIVPGAIVDAPQSVASVEVQTSSRTQTMRPLLISEDSNLARFFKLYEKFTSAKPHPNVEGNTEVGEEGGTQQRTFLADDMAAFNLAEETPKKQFQVVAFTRGGTQDSLTEIAFNLTQANMDYLSKWLNKEVSQLKDTASSYCLSLGCYSSRELLERLGKQLNPTFEVIASMPSVWPHSGGLSMNVNFGGSRKDLPLAPPLVITADGYVDLSEFALLGRNSITIHQEEEDFSDYTFVLHAHNPTLGQLQEIMRQRKSEVEWKDWLVGVTQPLHIDVPPLSLAPF
ncbi:hypothetical protein AGABI2DRAFT_115293 [Agaricus bisporus var. bisporus H97]|uniref:hypothetical protein n=1 Tax=Agaricus bisporus var. bisporus (strain H97 / ATCC MYA-4626 / FGSC 10389) TaxID=936046 RepID=UPI00029F6029|nr:hypothetical protein AGABI2DRAFT_115293 [Agaricus bisporus var. bisporus H97]EKV50234.1 hypothetical protein AGABI2DRAFT_115293 [Agaricus bisporus var. bisporus H97]